MSSDNSAGHVSRRGSSSEPSSDTPSSDNGHQLHGEWTDSTGSTLERQEIEHVLEIAQKVLAEVRFIHDTFAEEDITCDSFIESNKNKDNRRALIAVKASIQSYISIFENMINHMVEPFLSQHVNIGLSGGFRLSSPG
jgi:hypothetical protein